MSETFPRSLLLDFPYVLLVRTGHTIGVDIPCLQRRGQSLKSGYISKNWDSVSVEGVRRGSSELAALGPGVQNGDGRPHLRKQQLKDKKV